MIRPKPHCRDCGQALTPDAGYSRWKCWNGHCVAFNKRIYLRLPQQWHGQRKFDSTQAYLDMMKGAADGEA